MKKFFYALSLLLAAIIVIQLSGCANPFASPGTKLLGQAQKLERKTEYIKAYDAYLKAAKNLRQEGKAGKVYQCREAITRVGNIKLSYPLTEDEARKVMKETIPGITDRRIDEIIRDGRLPHLKFGNQTYYFDGLTNTATHIYSDLHGKQTAGALGKSTHFFNIMSRYIYEKDTARPGQTLVNPINYLARGQVILKRKDFPKSGLLKVWLPLPLTTAAQTNVRILSIYPRKYVKYPLKLDGDIGLAYLEIPLEEVKADLKIGIKLTFTHYEERYRVDPEKIGEYDKKSWLYQRYTASDKNIAVTPAIRARARKLAGKETNPLKIAKIFFDHIIWDLDYSFLPHGAISAMDIPESVYVDEHGYGDCGAQSMYFAALCRARGIPARAPGGYQLFPISETGCGTHFWAQIYLPNYGWFPVDTSAGQIARYMPQLTDKQQHDFANYYFGRMDPFRYLIQKDVDIELIPKPDGPLVFPMVLQTPTAVCAEMDENPGMPIMDNWKLTVRQVN
ncbi:MAG: transglutaminase domain-containing protein [Candidatus Margulisiibacteriota bacterium]